MKRNGKLYIMIFLSALAIFVVFSAKKLKRDMKTKGSNYFSSSGIEKQKTVNPQTFSYS
jgi:hypothetical protein